MRVHPSSFPQPRFQGLSSSRLVPLDVKRIDPGNEVALPCPSSFPVPSIGSSTRSPLTEMAPKGGFAKVLGRSFLKPLLAVWQTNRLREMVVQLSYLSYRP